MTAEPDNSCMIWAFRKLGIDRFDAEATGEILMSERWFYAEVVPKRKKCKKDEKSEKGEENSSRAAGNKLDDPDETQFLEGKALAAAGLELLQGSATSQASHQSYDNNKDI